MFKNTCLNKQDFVEIEETTVKDHSDSIDLLFKYSKLLYNPDAGDSNDGGKEHYKWSKETLKTIRAKSYFHQWRRDYCLNNELSMVTQQHITNYMRTYHMLAEFKAKKKKKKKKNEKQLKKLIKTTIVVEGTKSILNFNL